MYPHTHTHIYIYIFYILLFSIIPDHMDGSSSFNHRHKSFVFDSNLGLPFFLKVQLTISQQ